MPKKEARPVARKKRDLAAELAAARDEATNLQGGLDYWKKRSTTAEIDLEAAKVALVVARAGYRELRAERGTAWDRNRDLNEMADAVVSVLCRALELTQTDLHNSEDAKDSYIRSYAQVSQESRDTLLSMKPRVCNVRYMGEGTFEKLLKLWTMKLP